MLYRIRNIGYYRDGGTIELEIIDGRYYCIHKDTKKLYKGRTDDIYKENAELVESKLEKERIIDALETYVSELEFEMKSLKKIIVTLIQVNL